MANHSRRNSRGSFSIFSFDTIRSLSRAGSRQAVRLRDENEPHFRSQSSLSCDPNRQHLSPEPADTGLILTHDRLPSSQGVNSLLHRSNTSPAPHSKQDSSSTAATVVPDTLDRKSNKSRPLSWLPFSRPSRNRQCVRSKSLQLPKDNSSSTVARSVISAPVLQSTTNQDVAKVEGVRCGDLSNSDFDQSSWDGQVGWVPRRPGSPEPVVSSTGAEALASKIDEALKQVSDGGASKKSSAAVDSSARARLARFRDNLTNKVRHPRHGSTNDTGVKREQFVRLKDGQTNSPTVDQRIVRRKTETLNLCRDKIRSLTGHGNIKRKEVVEGNDGVHLAKEKEDQHLLADDIDVELGKPEISDRDSDFGFGSLTRSFASAVDKLDFQSTISSRKIPFLRSKTSLPDTRLLAAEMDDKAEPTLDHPSTVLPGLYGKPETNRERTIETSKTEPCTFSVADASLVPRPDRISSLPSGMNPLRCHPGVMEFAQPPVSASAEPTPAEDTANPRIEISKEDDEDDLLEDLEDAPIFSPSLGDLSQYSRLTPSSASTTPQFQTPVGLSPGNLHQRSRTIQYDTPTRPSGKAVDNRNLKPNLRKSRSNLGLFKKSHSEKIMTATQQERAKHSEVIGHHHGSPLTARDENQKIEVKKSKSMIFGAFGSRKPTSPETPISPPIRGAYQPPTPSPLRQASAARYPASPGLALRGKDEIEKRPPFRPDRPPTFIVPGGKGDGKEVKDFI